MVNNQQQKENNMTETTGTSTIDKIKGAIPLVVSLAFVILAIVFAFKILWFLTKVIIIPIAFIVVCGFLGYLIFNWLARKFRK